jgi:type VI secretion system protein ImpM
MEECVLGYYGKLPLWPEFLRLNAGGSEVQDLDRWFQEGMHVARRQFGPEWNDGFKKFSPWNLLFCPEGSLRFLIGVCVASCDSAGREFPFFLFLRVERGAFRLPLSFAPVCFGACLRAFREQLQNNSDAKDIKELRAGLEKLDVSTLPDASSILEAYRQYVQTETVGQFWSHIFGDFDDQRKYYVDKNLRDSVEPLSREPVGRLPWGLKFPLMPGSFEDAYDIPVWLDCIARWWKHSAQPTLLLWNRSWGMGEASLLTVAKRPSARNFLFMTQPDLKDESWFDLASVCDGMNSDVNLASRGNLLANRSLTLDAYLNSISVDASSPGHVPD